MGLEDLLEIKKRHREEQHKYAYFLLAISVAAIGFTIQITTGKIISWPMIFLGASILLWGLSFFFGCRNRLWSTMTLYASIGLIQLQEGIHPEQPDDPQELTLAIQTVNDAEKSNSDKAGFYGRWQLRLLILGGISFFIWHVIELANNTITK